MLALNITIFFQMINFWLAFYVLTRWLWRPALKLIIREEREQQSLESKIESQQKSVSNNEHRRERLWNMSRQQFAQHTPSVGLVFIKSTKMRQYTMPLVEDSDESKMVTEVARYIVSKANHV